METKTDKVVALIKAGQMKEALAIVKTFKLGFTKKEKELLVRAHEATWNPEFYAKMGHNPKALFDEACDLMKRQYTR